MSNGGNGVDQAALFVAFVISLVGLLLTGLAIVYCIGTGIQYLKRPAVEPCPPYDQCTPRGDWNHANCKCWDAK